MAIRPIERNKLMAKKAFKTHGQNRTDSRTLAEWLRAKEEFTGNSASGKTVGKYDTYSDRLRYAVSEDVVRSFENGVRDGDVDYVVYSYATPMAWHSQTDGWVMPDAKYSVTTSKFQGTLAAALSVL